MSIPSLPPVGGGDPDLLFDPLNSTSPPSVSSFSSSTIADGLSGYSSSIAAGNPLTIKEFSHIMLSASNEQQQTNWETQQFNANRRQAFYMGLALEAMNALTVYVAQTQSMRAYTTLYNDNQDQLTQVNLYIDAYNSDTVSPAQNAIDDVNAAIAHFNSLTNITAEDFDDLNEAILIYNSLAESYNFSIDDLNGIIDAFNEHVSDTNNTISTLNENHPDGVTFVGQSAYPSHAQSLPILSSVPDGTSPPISSVSFSPGSLPGISSTMSPPSTDSDTILQNMNDAYQERLQNQLSISHNILQNQSDFTSFIQFYLQGLIIAFPAAFTTPLKGAAPNTSGGQVGSGSGVSLASIVTALTNPLMAGIIAQGIYNTNIRLQLEPATPAVLAELQYLSLQLLSQVGLQAGSLVTRLLAGRLASVDLRSSSVAVALGLTLASEIGLAVGSGAVLGAIKDILAKAYPSLSGADLNTLASRLAAATELLLLEAGLFQLGQSLGNPSLFAQVLGSLSSVQALGLQDQPSFTENVSSLKQALINDLVHQANISYEQASRAITDDLISDSLQAQFNRDLIVDRLTQQGISSQDAINTANLAQAYLKAEISGRGILDDRFSADRLSQSVLSNQLVQGIVTNQPELTNRQLRDQLAQAFIANGNTPQNAFSAATSAVVGYGIPDVNADALRQNLLQTSVQHLAALGNGPTEANSLANQLVSSVLGPDIPGSQTSLRGLIDERLNLLIQGQSADLTETVRQNLKNFLEPTIELYSFADRIRDPANTFLLCAQTGVMYAHPQPTNYRNSVDIIV